MLQEKLSFLKTSNTKIVDSSARPIILQGLNLANLFLIETWMTNVQGVADHQSIIDTLKKRFSNLDLLEIFEQNYIQNIDFDNMANLGANLVRLPFYYKLIENDKGLFVNFAKLDRVIEQLGKRNIYTLLDLHGAPGGQNNEMHCGQKNKNKLFDDSKEGIFYRTKTIDLWKAIAEHYKNNPHVMGYDLLNEPFGAKDNKSAKNGLWTLYDNIYKVIRAVDPGHIIVMSSVPSNNDWATLPNPKRYNWKNVVYGLHYYGFKFNLFGKINGTLTAKKHHEYLIKKINNSKQEHYNVPILVSEFNGFDNKDSWTDYLDTFQKLGWHHTLWSYKHNEPDESWGLYTSEAQKQSPPNILTDSETDLKKKFELYNSKYYKANKWLHNILKKYWK